MLIHKLPQTPYTGFPLDWQVWAQENTVYSAFSKCILWWAMDLVGKPNTTSPIWNHFHSCHPSAFVQVSSSSRDRKRPAGQVCVVEALSELENTNETVANGRCQQEMWQHKPRFLFHRERVQTRSCLVAEQWTVSKPDAASQHNRLSLSTGHLNLYQHVINRTRQFTVRDLSCSIAPHLV